MLTNEQKSQKEVDYFLKKKPLKYMAYISMDGNTVSTWTGQKLGDIISKSETKIRRGFMGTKYSIIATGINGFKYKGIGTLGGYIKLRRTR